MKVTLDENEIIDACVMYLKVRHGIVVQPNNANMSHSEVELEFEMAAGSPQLPSSQGPYR